MPSLPARRLPRGLRGSRRVPGPVRRDVRRAVAATAGPTVGPLHGFPGPDRGFPGLGFPTVFPRRRGASSRRGWWRKPARTRPLPRLPLPPAPPRLLRCLARKHRRSLSALSHQPILSTHYLNLQTFPSPIALLFVFLSPPRSLSSISNLKRFSFSHALSLCFPGFCLPPPSNSVIFLCSESLFFQALG